MADWRRPCSTAIIWIQKQNVTGGGEAGWPAIPFTALSWMQSASPVTCDSMRRGTRRHCNMRTVNPVNYFWGAGQPELGGCMQEFWNRQCKKRLIICKDKPRQQRFFSASPLEKALKVAACVLYSYQLLAIQLLYDESLRSYQKGQFNSLLFLTVRYLIICMHMCWWGWQLDVCQHHPRLYCTPDVQNIC